MNWTRILVSYQQFRVQASIMGTWYNQNIKLKNYISILQISNPCFFNFQQSVVEVVDMNSFTINPETKRWPQYVAALAGMTNNTLCF